MGLRLVYLTISRVFSWLRLSRRPDSWKTAEILLLRHQLTVLQRQVRARPKMSWADRAFIALLLEVIPKRRRPNLRLIVAPQTILRWHRDIARRRWAAKSRHKQPGRPRTHRNIARQVLRLDRENPNWGYRRIHGELAGLGIQVAPSTVWEILTKAGAAPAPRRVGPTWTQFLHSQAQAIIATDFFTVDLLDGTSAYVLAVIEHATLRIRVLGVTLRPNNAWVTQMARNVVMDLDEHLESVRVPAPQPRHQVQRRLRHGLHRRGNPDPAQPDPCTPSERDHGTLDRQLPPRTTRPDPHLEPGTCLRSSASTKPTTMSIGRTAPWIKQRRSKPYLQQSPIWTTSACSAANESAAPSTNIGSHHDRMTFSAPTGIVLALSGSATSRMSRSTSR